MTRTCPHCGGTANQVAVTWEDAQKRANAEGGTHAGHVLHHHFPLIAVGIWAVTVARTFGHKFLTFRCEKCGRDS